MSNIYRLTKFFCQLEGRYVNSNSISYWIFDRMRELFSFLMQLRIKVVDLHVEKYFFSLKREKIFTNEITIPLPSLSTYKFPNAIILGLNIFLKAVRY